MLNERIAELIQADVDGELVESDRPELTAALEESAEARQFRDEMMRLDQMMSNTPDEIPPWGLARRIANSIELPSPSRFSVWSANFTSHWFTPASYGLAVAAGVLLAVGMSQVTPKGPEDLRGLVGTMVSQGHEVPGVAVGRLNIDLDVLRGQVQIKNLEQTRAVEFDLQSTDEVEISVVIGESGMQFAGFANQGDDAGLENIEVSEGKVRVMNQGDHQFVLFLRNQTGTEVDAREIGIVVSHQGSEIYRGLLGSRG